MNQDNNCSNCNHRIFGRGCLLTNERVTDHQHCSKWEKLKNESIHDKPAIEQYKAIGYILELEEST